MDYSERDFQVLDALDRNEITTQRQLAKQVGISLGQVNYVLKNLLSKGLIKLGNFRKSPNKIGYAYFLTPKGVEEKSKLAVRFVVKKLEEYHQLRSVLSDKLAAIRMKGLSRMIIVGPEIVTGFIRDLIQDGHNHLVIVEEYRHWKSLYRCSTNSFDIVLLFDGSQEGLDIISEKTGIPKKYLEPLW